MKIFIIYFAIIGHSISRKLSLKNYKSIVGGDEVTEGNFTYQVSLQYNGHHVCGGGIISELHVITAAHCVINETDGQFMDIRYTAVIGVSNLKKLNNNAINILIERVYVPREYKPEEVDPDDNDHVPNDIAILRLYEPFDLDGHPHLTLLKLPEMPYSNYAGKEAIVTGFGWNKIEVKENPITFENVEKGTSDGKMRYSLTDILTNDECEHSMTVPIHTSDICARVEQDEDGDEIRGVCSGDSGSPLVYQGNYVIGILSLNPVGCKEEFRAGVYTRVTSYIRFIRNSLHNLRTPDIRVARWYMQFDCVKNKEISFLVEKKMKKI